MGENWTLAELVQRANRALAAAAVRAPNGRVSDMPDARMVRWYATTGLLDRPVIRGRVAYYGERHLLQLVAVKRLQAQGLTLAAIQRRLAGAREATLRELAALPSSQPFGASITPDGHGRTLTEMGGRPTEVPASRSRPRFWAERPSTHSVIAGRALATGDRDSDSESADSATAVLAGDLDTGVLYALRVGGAIVLLPREPDADDVAAIRAAARPLHDVLMARGLLAPQSRQDQPTRRDPQKGTSR